MPVTFLTSEDEKKFVKSVNGAVPDENGDVEVKSVTSWNDLTDRPFGYAEIILPETTREFTEDDHSFEFYDLPLLIDGETYVVHCNGVKYEMVAVYDEMMETYYLSKWDEDGNAICPILLDQVTYGGGIHRSFVNLAETQYGSYTFSITRGELKTVDEEYIPDTIARKTDVTWENLPDKPFGMEPVVIVPETTIAPHGRVDLPDLPLLIEGEVYIIIVDGVKYEIEAVFEPGMADYSVYSEDCPVSVYNNVDMGNVIDGAPQQLPGGAIDNTSSATVIASVFKVEPKTLDEAYIPDTIARKSDVTWENLPDKPFGDGERTLIADVESFEGGVYIDAPELILGDTYIVEAYGQEAACESYYNESTNACYLTMPDDGDLFDLSIAYEYDKGKLFMATMGLPTPIKLYHIELKTIDEQYLPYKNEEWTFELADGSTVTKQVVVK